MKHQIDDITGECAACQHEFAKPVPECPPSPATPPENQSGSNGVLGSVKRNIEHNGVEIAFNDKPDDDLRYRLKRAGFRITRRPPWRWYQKFTQAAWNKACELAGIPEQGDDSADPTSVLNTPEEGYDPAGAMVQANEDCGFDATARAIGA